jgi:hypothetical protein
MALTAVWVLAAGSAEWVLAQFFALLAVMLVSGKFLLAAATGVPPGGRTRRLRALARRNGWTFTRVAPASLDTARLRTPLVMERISGPGQHGAFHILTFQQGLFKFQREFTGILIETASPAPSAVLDDWQWSRVPAGWLAIRPGRLGMTELEVVARGLVRS